MTNTNAIITKTYNGSTVLTFRKDGYFNMTFAAKAFGKHLPHFFNSPETQDYLDALSSTTESVPLEIVPGNRYVADRGTWAHPKLAVYAKGYCIAKGLTITTKKMAYTSPLNGETYVNDIKVYPKEALEEAAPLVLN